jgi:hypothetical protein
MAAWTYRVIDRGKRTVTGSEVPALGRLGCRPRANSANRAGALLPAGRACLAFGPRNGLIKKRTSVGDVRAPQAFAAEGPCVSVVPIGQP